MKRIPVVILLITIISFSYSQENILSVEAQGGGLFYLAKGNATTRIKQAANFDGGIILSYHANKFLQLKTGISVFSKRYSEYFSWPTQPPDNSYEDENHLGLYYLRIPVLFSINYLNHGKWSYNTDVGLSMGFLFHKYRRATLHDGTASNGFTGLYYYYQNPLFLEISSTVQYSLSKKISIELIPWYRYMYINDFLKIQNAYTVSLSHSQVGLSGGLTYALGWKL